MATVLVLHRVRDYAKWRQVYDSVEPLRKAGGVIEHSVYRADGDPDNVLVQHRFSSREAARSYFENPAVIEAVREAGVDEKSARLEFFEEA